MSRYISPEQFNEFKKIFEIIDDDGGGTISIKSVSRILKSFNVDISDQEIETVSRICGLFTNSITVEDLSLLLASLLGLFNPLKKAFEENDKNKSGTINRADLALAYQQTMNGYYYKNQSASHPVTYQPDGPKPGVGSRQTSTTNITTTTTSSVGGTTITNTTTTISSQGGLSNSTLSNTYLTQTATGENAKSVVQNFLDKYPNKNEFSFDDFILLCEYKVRPPAFYTHHVYDARWGDVCTICKRLIKDHRKGSILIDDIYYHPKCYRCISCGKQLNEKVNRPLENGELYCSDCPRVFPNYT